MFQNVRTVCLSTWASSFPVPSYGGKALFTRYGDEYRIDVPKQHGIETPGQRSDGMRIPKSLFVEAAMLSQKAASAA